MLFRTPSLSLVFRLRTKMSFICIKCTKNRIIIINPSSTKSSAAPSILRARLCHPSSPCGLLTVAHRPRLTHPKRLPYHLLTISILPGSPCGLLTVAHRPRLTHPKRLPCGLLTVAHRPRLTHPKGLLYHLPTNSILPDSPCGLLTVAHRPRLHTPIVAVSIRSI